jgi:hypothetical protein
LAALQPRPNGTARPRWFALTLTTETGERAWWDSGQITGTFERTPAAGVFHNQIGYEKGAPKHFTAWCNHQPRSATFELLNEGNSVVYQGNLARPERITGPYGRPWEHYYARGDFSAFDGTGAFRLRVIMDDTVAESEPFDIGEEILWERLIPAALEYLHSMASGEDIPNVHPAWHLDDARDPENGSQLDLQGGWYEDGRFAKRDNAEILLYLADAWEVAGWRLKDTAGQRGAGKLDAAIRHGANFVQKLATEGPEAYAGVAEKSGYLGDPGQQTDNLPGTGDEREAVPGGRDDDMAYVLALAGLATEGAYTGTAASLATRAHEAGVQSPALFGAAIQLYQSTGEAAWGEMSAGLLPTTEISLPWLALTEPLIFYEDEFVAAMSAQLAVAHSAFADGLRGLADNPFGVVTYGPPGQPHYFAPEAVDADKAIGNTPYILRMALAVARAHRFAPSVEYKTFILDQINWLLGNNPAGISLMEGQGRTHLPAYHSHLVFAGIGRGALPGAIANGFVPRGPGDGRPHIDMRKVDLPDWRSNACATKNAALLIDVIANYKRSSFMAMRAPQ